MPRFERKKHYVDSSVQGGLIRRILLHWVYFFSIIAFLFVVLRTMLGDPTVPASERFTQSLGEFALLGIVIVATLPAFALDTIRFSNRFAGPIVRIRRAIRELAKDGTTDPVHFRENDFWQDIAVELNKLRERIEAHEAAGKDEPARV